MDPIAMTVIGILNRIEIPYMVVGSLSSNFYGLPRSTKDADFVLKFPIGRHLREIVAELPEGYKIDLQATFELVTGSTRYQLSVAESLFEVELFLLTSDAHDLARFERRILVDVGQPVYVPTAEDVIVTKLRWFRLKDQEDIKNILVARPELLDWVYIDFWTTIHRTTQSLDRLRAEI